MGKPTLRRVFSLATFLAIAAVGRPAAASDRFVSIQGSDTGNDCLSSGTPCRTHAHAVAQAASGDIVKATSGSYDESLTVDYSTTLALSGSWTADFSSRDPASNGTKLNGTLEVAAGLGEVVGVTLDGFTITRSEGITASSSGDGVLALTLDNCSLRRTRGFAALYATSSESSMLTLDVSSSTIRANRVRGSAVEVWSFDTSVLTFTMADSLVERNVAEVAGGFQGGGIALRGSLSGTLTNTDVYRNRGSGIVAGGTTSIVASRIDGNRQGGIATHGTVTITNSVVARNRFVVSDFHGSASGGIQAYSRLNVVNSTIRGNRSPCTSSSTYCSGGIGVSGVPVTLTNTIVWGNDGVYSNADDLTIGDGATVNVDHSDLGDVSGSYVDLGGNISAAPFSSRRDDHLTAGSPAVDTGTCSGAPATDFEGDPRPTGAGCDMGADELVP